MSLLATPVRFRVGILTFSPVFFIGSGRVCRGMCVDLYGPNKTGLALSRVSRVVWGPSGGMGWYRVKKRIKEFKKELMILVNDSYQL